MNNRFITTIIVITLSAGSVIAAPATRDLPHITVPGLVATESPFSVMDGSEGGVIAPVGRPSLVTTGTARPLAVMPGSEGGIITPTSSTAKDEMRLVSQQAGAGGRG